MRVLDLLTVTVMRLDTVDFPTTTVTQQGITRDAGRSFALQTHLQAWERVTCRDARVVWRWLLAGGV